MRRTGRAPAESRGAALLVGRLVELHLEVAGHDEAGCQAEAGVLDLAIELRIPIVPIRISGGLPVQPVLEKLEFPVAHCAQDYRVGVPIFPEELAGLAYGERGRRVLAAINGLGPPLKHEKPNTSDPGFSARVKQWQREPGASEVEATFFRVLQEVPLAGPELLRLVEGARHRVLQLGSDSMSVWLGTLAGKLYGPKGPRVEIEAED